jgi:phosphonate transport system permease protein
MAAIAGGTTFVVGSLVYLNANPFAFIHDFHFVVNLIEQMLPPDLALFWHKQSMLSSLVDTVSMAFLGTLGGAAIAIVLALLAATNTTPHRAVRIVVRTLLATERCTPNFVVLLVLLIAVGIGPFAAMLSLLIGSIGMFGKLFADAIEQVDAGPVDATAVVGASRLQIIRYAVLPQVLASIVANVFYAFDVNLRAAVALGVFGGGGIGFEMHVAQSVLRYKDMLACIVLIVVMINLMERVADAVRRRILSTEAQLT